MVVFAALITCLKKRRCMYRDIFLLRDIGTCMSLSDICQSPIGENCFCIYTCVLLRQVMKAAIATIAEL